MDAILNTITPATAAFVVAVPRTRQQPLTWATLCDAEPRLVGLAHQAELADPTDWHAWRGIRQQLDSLVGWHAAQPALRNSDAYELACRELSELFEGGTP